MDITERMKAEEALRDSELRLRTIITNAPIILFALDNEGVITLSEGKGLETLGLEPNESVGQSVFDLYRDRPEFLEHARRALAGGSINTTIELGGAAYEIRSSPLRAQNGEVAGVIGVAVNVTERKRAEEALEESERRYAAVLSNARAYIYRCRNEPGYPNEFASDYALDLTGYTPEDLLVSGSVRFGDLIVEENRKRVWEEVQSALARGERFELRYAIHRRDGEIRHVEEYGQGVYDEEGEAVALEGLVYDVTELKRTEERLREAEQRYRTLVEQIPAVIYVQQATGSNAVTYVSPQIESMLGYGPEEYTSDPEHRIKILHPADRQRVLAEDKRSNETGEPFKMEYRQFARDGRVVWIRDEAALVRDEEGEPLYWQGVFMDVTERKRAEEALRDSELRLRTIVTSVPVVLFALNRAGVFTLSEGRGLDVLGLEPGEVVGHSISEIYGDRSEILEDIDRALAGEEFSAVREVDSRTFETWYSPLMASTGGVTGVIGVATDVTERKEAEEALRRSEASLAEAQRMAHLGNWEWNLKTSEVWWSEEVFRIYGFKAGEFAPSFERLLEVVHPDDRGLLREKIEGALYKGEPYDFEHRVVRSDGEERVVHRRAEVLRDESGEPLRMVGTVHDITERKEAEERIKASEAELRALFAAMNDVILVLDSEGRYLKVVPTNPSLLVGPPDDLVGKTLHEVFSQEQADEFLNSLQRALESQQAVNTEYSLRIGERDVWFAASISPMLEDQVIIVARDVTERKRAEEEMKEANRRLEELAVLKADFTAMVAHELDTPLAVIRGYADMLATDELEPADRDHVLARIQAETDVLNALVADVRTASAVERDDFAIELQQVPVGSLLDEAAAFVKTLPDDRPMTIETAADGQVWADPYRIGQVLRNLLSNAVKYSPDGAPVELRTMPGMTSGSVRIEVADQGVGIHSDDAARIFEKFGRGRDKFGRKVAGVGLGLYLSRRILRAHGSDLTLDPAPEGGSVFGFKLEAAR